MSSNNARHFDTIVIGAGVSGLACAARLFQHQARKVGGDNLRVLEARNRIGGRVGSVHVNGHRLDTGANWIHGIGSDDEPNPLMKILPHKRYKQLSGMVAFRPLVWGLSSQEATVGNGWQDVAAEVRPSSTMGMEREPLVIPSEHAGTLMGTMWATIGYLHETAERTPAAEAKSTTLLKALAKCEDFREAFQLIPPVYHPALSSLPQFVESMEAGPLAAQSAEHYQDSPGMGLLEYAIEDYDGDQVFLQDGYTAVIDELAKDLVDANVIETGVEVNQIDWNADPIMLTTSAGEYTAKTVICSIPLGVLKERQEQSMTPNATTSPLFQPPLPREKTEAISSLGFGTLDKIFLVYSHPWWTEEPYVSIWKKGFSRRPFAPGIANEHATEDQVPDSMWGFTDELPGIGISADGGVSSGPRLLSIMNLHNLTGIPALSCFISCANAVQIESFSDAAAASLLHRTLTTWLGREPPRPDAVHVTRWSKDEFSYGSYSHMITGLSETKHREEFQKPLLNRSGTELRFVGEHTSRNHFATVHGALLSGWREADSMLKREGLIG